LTTIGTIIYTYDVNLRLSQLLIKTENNAVTKYVYGLGLIGEEISGNFKTYHFDYRGSTVAITNANGTVTDTFEYDTYGKLTAHSGSNNTQFLYNGRDGVLTEDNGLIYMRARYYSPTLRRFVNADKVHGDITNSLSLNRYTYVNGNPASFVDPEGLKGIDARGGNPIQQNAKKVYFGSEYTALTINDVDCDKINDVDYDNTKANKDQQTLIDTFKTIVSYLPDSVSVSEGLSGVILLGPNGNINYSVNVKGGNGNINISAVYSEQIKLASTFTFQTNGVGVSYTPSSNNTVLRYSCPITDSTTISASVNGIPGNYLSANYTITTKCGDNNSMYTSVGIDYYNNPQPPKSKELYSSISVPSESYSTDLALVGVIIAAGVVVGMAAASPGGLNAYMRSTLTG